MVEQPSNPQQDKPSGRRNTQRPLRKLSPDPQAMGERLARLQEGRRAYKQRRFLPPRSQD